MLLLLPRNLFPLGRMAALLAGPALVGLGAGFCRTATCQGAQSSELACAPAAVAKEPEFDWVVFWKFLRPQLLTLVAAIVVSLLQVGPFLFKDVTEADQYTSAGSILT